VSLFFVSHSSEDRQAASQLRERLHSWGYASTFLDFDPDEGIQVGERWEKVLYRELDRADAVIYLGTQAASASKWCAIELAIARSRSKQIFPLDLDGSGPNELLKDRQGIDVRDGDGSFERLRLALARDFDPTDEFAWDHSRAPYPGLRAFGTQDAAVFFGRDDTVRLLMDRLDPTLQYARAVAVIGASGSGKSSLVRAGVLPRLGRSGGDWFVVPPFTPGERPTAALSRALAGAGAEGGRAAVQSRLEADPAELPEIVRDLAERDGDRRSVVIVVDQAEELVVLSGSAERDRFLTIVAAALEAAVPLCILATLRSEFLSAWLQDERLVELVRDPLLVGPLGRSRLAEVILGPARKAGLAFQDGLVDRMIDETRGGDALPLLAYTLRELYDCERDDRSRVTAAEYDEVGGVLGALRRSANAVADTLKEGGRGERVVPTLLRLVTLDAEGEPARKRLRLDDLDPTEREIVGAFVDARLLVTDRRGDDEVVEVAHEALLRSWPPLVAAIEESRDRLRLQAELERDAREWDEAGRPSSYLLREERLARARRLLAAAGAAGLDDLGDRERDFFRASEALEERERAAHRRRRWIAFGVLGLFVAVIGAAAIISLKQAQDARDQRNVAVRERKAAVSRQLAATALTRLQSDSELSLLLALEANEIDRNEQARDALREVLRRSPVNARLPLSAAATGVQFSPDGKLLLARTEKTVDGFDPVTGRSRFSVPAAAGSVTLDGDRMLTVGDGAVRLWSTRDGTPAGQLDVAALAAGFVEGEPVAVRQEALGQLQLLDVPSGDVRVDMGSGFGLDAEGALVSPTGRHVLVWSFDLARVWDIRRGRWLGAPVALGGYVEDDRAPPAFSPDGRLVALPLLNRRVEIWSVAPLEHVDGIDVTATADSVAFSGDGRHLAIGNLSRFHVWSAATHTVRSNPTAVAGAVDVTLSDDGSRALVVESNGPVHVWDERRGRMLTTIPRRRGVDGAYALSPDGETVAAAGDRWALLYGVGGSRSSATLEGPCHAPRNVGIGSGDRVVAALGANGMLCFWSPDGRLLANLRPSRKPVGWDFSDDDRLLYAIDSRGNATVWDWRGEEEVARFSTGRERPAYFDLSPDGERLITGRSGGAITVWDVAAGEPLEDLPGHRHTVTLAEFTRDGRFIVTSAVGEPTRVWRAAAPDKPLHTLGGKDNDSYAAVVADGGTRAVTSPLRYDVEVWDVATGSRVPGTPPRVPDADEGRGFSLLADARGETIAASIRGRSWVWDFTDPALERVELPVGHTSAVLSGDGRYLVTPGSGRLTISEAGTGATIEEFRWASGGTPRFAVANDGQWLAAVAGSHVRLISCRLCAGDDALIALARSQVTRELSPDERRKFLGGR